MEKAIEQAVTELTLEEDRKHEKHCSKKKSQKKYPNVKMDKSEKERCTCMEKKLEIQQGKTSALMNSPSFNRKLERREAVAARNTTEQRLVKETIKKL